jgi:hypothetical protein
VTTAIKTTDIKAVAPFARVLTNTMLVALPIFVDVERRKIEILSSLHII